MNKQLRVLIVEDSEFDARLLVNMLRKGGYEPAWRRVETAADMREALNSERWEMILSDYNLPNFSAPDALKLLQSTVLDIPFIIVSGGIGEDIAVAAMKAGANDYLMKGNLARLSVAVERELRETEVRLARREAEISLRDSESRYRQLWETATDAVLLMDDQLVISFGNPAVQEVFGVACEALYGKNLAALGIELVWGERRTVLDPQSVEEIVNSRLRAVVGAAKKTDGADIVLGVAFSVMQLGGRKHFVGFFRDLTQQRRAEAELRENQEQFRVAREIQHRLFPKAAPTLAGFEIAGTSFPAEATGGDYFDYLAMQGGRLGVVVGDVTGHGLGPALLMAETRAFLRLLVLNREDVGEILTRANLALAADVDYEHYVTLLFALIDPATRTLLWANAGHTAGVVLSADGRVRLELKRTGIPLGLKAANTYATQAPVPLFPGDVILLLTDGLEETPSPAGELFGAARVVDVAREHRARPAAEILSALIAAMRAFAGRDAQEDDVTAVVIKVAG